MGGLSYDVTGSLMSFSLARSVDTTVGRASEHPLSYAQASLWTSRDRGGHYGLVLEFPATGSDALDLGALATACTGLVGTPGE